ncbi:MAG: DUF2062 domain-containing protein [Pseudomonadota bacterium]|nr:DUF2062 domain-containing protein [Pseudomonadota bacterium]
MAKGWLKKHLPSSEDIHSNKAMRIFGRLLARPSLWRLNRHSVARGVAIGLVTGLIPGPFQILAAAAIAIGVRANLAVAALTTFYTNPFTFVPLYILAYNVGALATGNTAPPPPIAEFKSIGVMGMIQQAFSWVYSLGDTLLIGLAIQSSIFAVVGYFSVQLAWRWAATRKWNKRKLRQDEVS